MKNTDYEIAVELFKALCEPMRIKIIDAISCRELCACEILECLSISQSTLSHHMKILTACDIVVARKEATWMYYSINKKTVAKLHQFIDLLTDEKMDCKCHSIKKNCTK
ncbi:MAG: winged helix-turn-helix transcriptional regulator [Oligoflexia bacterium]|nr:winged helix-turn-helix transcriptional regulator [Oligoflexia bacterium]